MPKTTNIDTKGIRREMPKEAAALQALVLELCDALDYERGELYKAELRLAGGGPSSVDDLARPVVPMVPQIGKSTPCAG